MSRSCSAKPEQDNNFTPTQSLPRFRDDFALGLNSIDASKRFQNAVSARRLRNTYHAFVKGRRSSASQNCLAILAHTDLITSDENRFGASSLHQRDPRSALFENYSGGSAGSREATPPRGGGYGYQNGNLSAPGSSYRPATPNSRYDNCGQRYGRSHANFMQRTIQQCRPG